ncbi:hypothetical protein EB118_17610 [bacterium]|nr:hypothetical protein [bacterium]NDG31876.1 hypothetical protein [bacterium]
MLKASIIRYIILEKEDGDFIVLEKQQTTLEERVTLLEEKLNKIENFLFKIQVLESRGLKHKKVSYLPGDREND